MGDTKVQLGEHHHPKLSGVRTTLHVPSAAWWPCWPCTKPTGGLAILVILGHPSFWHQNLTFRMISRPLDGLKPGLHRSHGGVVVDHSTLMF